MSFDEKMKTPCYVIKLEKVIQNYNKMKSLITSDGRDDIIAYSIKANYNVGIIKTLNQMGSHFEVCSKYEYELIKKLGIDLKKIIVNGYVPFEFLKEIGKSSLVILDSVEQLIEWNKTKDFDIGLRINFDDFTKDSRFKNKESRFGIDLKDKKVKKILSSNFAKNQIIAIHCHFSGNSRNPSIYIDALCQISSIINEFKLDAVKIIDLGGGFKVGDKFWSFEDYINVINKKICELKLKHLKVIYEPGNCLVNNSATYHTTVIAEKKLYGREYKIVDGTILHLPNVDASLLNYKFKNFKQNNINNQLIVGATCKESDVFVEIKNKNELKLGSEVIVKNVGAYSINEINNAIIGLPNIYVIK